MRKYGFCEADPWDPKDAAMAELLLKGLHKKAQQRRLDMGLGDDADAWCWPREDLPVKALLAQEVRKVSQEDEARPAIFLFSPELRATPPEGAVCRFEGRVASPLRLVRSTERRDGQDSAGEASFSSPNEHPVRLAWTCAFPEWPTTPARLPASVGMSLEAKGVVRAAIAVATWSAALSSSSGGASNPNLPLIVVDGE